MNRNEVKLINGQRRSVEAFIDHYKRSIASATQTPVTGQPKPVDVDISWYMGAASLAG